MYSPAKLMVLAPLLQDRINKPEDVCVVRDRAFLIYPDMYGDLRDKIKRLTEVEATQYFNQIVGMLHSAHSHSIALSACLRMSNMHFADMDR